MKKNIQKPTVQIVCVTYNQKDYIKEALDSFLMQKTNFKFEVLVGDDCSTDGTTEIVAEYAKKYPDIIKHIHRQPNMGCLANFMDLCESVTAKYAAFCDGDDYWTDENKLQKQFDFMEKNEDVNICAHRILLKGADNNWGLYEWYKKQKEPFITPQKKNLKFNKKIQINDISKEWLQMSSLFIRWKKIDYPQWAKVGTIGDMTIEFLQLADKYMYVFEDVMSVWRQGVKSVFASSKNQDLHFLRTRSEYIKILYNIINYFKKNYPNCAIDNFESRLWTEIVNYTNVIIKTDRFDLLLDLKEQYPDIYNKVKGLLSEYRYRLQQINILGVKRADLLRRKSVLKIIKPFLSIIYRIKKIIKQIGNIFNKIITFLAYWVFALVPKKKNLWVFSGFLKKNYMDNTMYLYEYIVKNHPEIEAVWLTRSKEVRKNLKERRLPVHRMNSPIGIWKMIRANIAFSDHYKVTDYDNRYGFNAGTKFVNLWHGVGLKDMRPKNLKIPNTSFAGLQLSTDIVSEKNDSILKRLFKLLKYPFVAPFRELFEKYFMIVCPGKQFVEYSALAWKIPEKAHFMCGYPRTDIMNNFIETKNNKNKILYAPTYRYIYQDEQRMISLFVENLKHINEYLESIDGTLTLRLHPHTWRNYQYDILMKIKNFPRILISEEKDIYKDLSSYSLLITDYSSIAYDFLLLNKPLIFLAFDYEEYANGDYNFQMPYKENCPGDIVSDWKLAISAIDTALNNNEYNSDLRKQVLDKFSPIEYNKDNSKHIVDELKKRIKLGGTK